MAVFDRSWYGRVLVERVDGFATEQEWERGYDEILHFERALALEGTVVIKLWLHISEKEQLQRFESRRDDPMKSWKLTPDDWHNREKRLEYEDAAEEMFERTDHALGRWDLVEAENKRYARVKVIRTVIHRIEEGMRRHGQEPPASRGVDFDQ
jgi:polyphosphate kinase 2 (PPK2 family)